MTTIDTTRTIKVHASPMKMTLLLIAAVGMTAAGVLISVMEMPDQPDAGVFGPFAAAFFGLCSVIIAWRLLVERGPVIVISPRGIRDTRVARELIPWRTIREISTWSYESQRILVLDVDPEAEKSLGLTTAVRWWRGVNRALGITGLCISATGLGMGYEDLLQICAAYLSASRDNVA